MAVVLLEQLFVLSCLSKKEKPMIRALLIDDEKKAAAALKKMLEEYCTGVEVIGEAQTALLGLRLIRELKPDVVFLDVEMPGGTGFDLLDAIEEKTFRTVFTTAHEQYVISALRSGAIDYLVKPISVEELRGAVSRIIIPAQVRPEQSPNSQSYRIPIISSEGTMFVSERDVICIEGDGRYSRFHLRDGTQHLATKNLGEIETELAAYRFFRIHKSWLVNCRHVVRISNTDGGFAVLTDGRELEISRRKKAEFVRAMTV